MQNFTVHQNQKYNTKDVSPERDYGGPAGQRQERGGLGAGHPPAPGPHNGAGQQPDGAGMFRH